MKTLAITAISDGIMGGRKCQRKAVCALFICLARADKLPCRRMMRMRRRKKQTSRGLAPYGEKARWDLLEMGLEIWGIVLYTGAKS